MPKRALPLTVKRVENEKRPGNYSDGHGLYLAVGERSKSWIFRYQLAGRRHDLGLGSVDLVSLKEARDRVLDLHRDIRNGIDPLASKRLGRAAHRKMITFAECARLYIDAHKSEWRDQKAWPDTVRLYCGKIANLPVNRIDDDNVLGTLEAIWSTRNQTAHRVRSRIEAILDFAVTKKYRDGVTPNPARWKGHLENLLAKSTKATKTTNHHAALDWREVPAVVQNLQTDTGIPATAALFAILTCTRAGEAAGARWPEIDLGARVWVIPPERMKAGAEHRIPLSAPALEILGRMAMIKSNSDDRVFPPRNGGAVRHQAMLKALKRTRTGITLHGMRASFSTWCAETNRDYRLCEISLAHAVGGIVERAYQRSDLLEERRALAEAWAAHCGA